MIIFYRQRNENALVCNHLIIRDSYGFFIKPLWTME